MLTLIKDVKFYCIISYLHGLYGYFTFHNHTFVKKSFLIFFFFIGLFFLLTAQKFEKTVIGVYQGKPLFIQNPYNPQLNKFCIEDVYVNGMKQDINYRLSAFRINFKNTEEFTPVTIRIVYGDSTCIPRVVNGSVIQFHSAYKFLDINLNDTALYWSVEGEREAGTYIIERLEGDKWIDEYAIDAEANFDYAEYTYLPSLEKGSNKYRIKYAFGDGSYLYSYEAEYEHYPEPVDFYPKVGNNLIRLSRPATFEVYDQKGDLVCQGKGAEIDISLFRPGDYLVYFDNQQMATFKRNKRPPVPK